jgi:lysylphosphatidylglycerol synthetase-like protein (DUF2156 family)
MCVGTRVVFRFFGSSERHNIWIFPVSSRVAWLMVFCRLQTTLLRLLWDCAYVFFRVSSLAVCMASCNMLLVLVYPKAKSEEDFLRDWAFFLQWVCLLQHSTSNSYWARKQGWAVLWCSLVASSWWFRSRTTCDCHNYLQIFCFSCAN